MNNSSKRIKTGLVLAVFLCLSILSSVAAGADGRFRDNGDGTVTDTKTGLMWAQTDNMGHINWHDAKLYCENIILSEHDDWRMPTIEELKTLFDRSMDAHETICGRKVRSAPQIELSCGFVWSSEAHAIPGSLPIEAMVYSFSNGYRFSARMSQYRGYRALPVRGAIR